LTPGRYLRKQKQKVLEALSKLDLEISDKDFGKYVDSFIKDLKDGLAGKSSSLKILPSFIKFPNQIPNQERIAVLAAGKVTLSKGNFQVSGEKSKVYGVMGYPMPGLGKELTIEGYFHQIINDARDVLRNCNKIGFCFRHAIEVNSKWDARLLEWSRAGVNVHGLEGRYIGEEFKKCLREEFDKDYKILLLNDTVATLIAGLSEACEKEFEDFIGLVHSSGYNLSYIENGKNITSLVKDKKYLKTQMVLNTQAGSFSKIKDS
jgi:hexokinase